MTLRAAIPLAIFAGCQTIAMLTGGIDLSVGAVASIAGFLASALVTGLGTPLAIAIALLVTVIGPRHRRRGGRLPSTP